MSGMKIHSLVQGTPEWHAHREAFFNASDAPAMLDCSPHKSRTQLLNEMVSGIKPEINLFTQKIFDDGHRYEELARPVAEALIKEDLYPTVGTRGNLSASFDGLTMDESIAWEHKTLNDAIRGAGKAANLPKHLRVQMEQQLMISGAKGCVFMATKWSPEDVMLEEVHYNYMPDEALRDEILRGWAQFDKDLKAHIVAAPEEKVVATPIMDLPALFVNASGEVKINSNLDVFGASLKSFVEDINRNPETDQDFADLEQAIKTLIKSESALKSAEEQALGQYMGIDEMRRTIAYLIEIARSNRLVLDKLLTSKKASIKTSIAEAAKAEFDDYVTSINDVIYPIFMVSDKPNFPEAMKNKRSIESLTNAVASELANAKIRVENTARLVTINLHLLEEYEGYKFLFHDMQSIVYQEPEFFKLTISTRIAEHKRLEDLKVKELRAKIQVEEEAKARAIIEQAKAAEEAKVVIEPEKIYPQIDIEAPAEETSFYSDEIKETYTVFKQDETITILLSEYHMLLDCQRMLDTMLGANHPSHSSNQLNNKAA